MQLFEAIEQYKASHEFQSLRPASKRAYNFALRKLDVVQDLELEEFTRPGIMCLRDYLSEKPAMADLVITLLRKILGRAYDRGLIEANHAKGVKSMNKGEPYATWNMDDIRLFLSGATSLAKDIAILALYTGQRRSDLVGVAYDNISFQLVPANMWLLRLKQIKTGTEVVVPLLYPVVERFKLERPHKRGELLLHDGMGNALSPERASWEIKQQVGRLALNPALCLHGLRKSCATFLAENGATAHEIMAITGHKTLAEAQLYTEKASQLTRAYAAMQKMPNMEN